MPKNKKRKHYHVVHYFKDEGYIPQSPEDDAFIEIMQRQPVQRFVSGNLVTEIKEISKAESKLPGYFPLPLGWEDEPQNDNQHEPAPLDLWQIKTATKKLC